LRLVRQVFRAHNPRWSFQPESGEGAARHGGRFNPLGMEALYTSLRMETAWLEAQQAFPFKAQPMTLVPYDVDCEDIVDLTDPDAIETLGITPSDLNCPWEDMVDRHLQPPTWDLARRLFDGGKAGIIVRSFATGSTAADVNAVFWRWGRKPPHQVAAVDDYERLPSDDRSWRRR
jgi:RES domain-containing protein